MPRCFHGTRPTDNARSIRGERGDGSALGLIDDPIPLRSHIVRSERSRARCRPPLGRLGVYSPFGPSLASTAPNHNAHPAPRADLEHSERLSRGRSRILRRPRSMRIGPSDSILGCSGARDRMFAARREPPDEVAASSVGTSRLPLAVDDALDRHVRQFSRRRDLAK